MAYRGEDVPANHGDWGRQTPWQEPSSGAAPGNSGPGNSAPPNTGAWGDGQQGYAGDESYPPANGGGFGYGPGGGYPVPGEQAYGQQDGQYADPHGQQQYGQYDGYGPGARQGGAAGYGDTSGYGQSGQQDGYGYDRGPGPSSGYGQAGYDQQPAAGYAPGGGYQGPSGGYGQPPAYPALPPAGSGSYPVPRGGSGGYPALPSGQGDYPAQDAGNDWYGGQPAAANGASFADTGTYRLNGRVIDEYGTGPRGALRDPAQGYQLEAGQQGTGQLPVQGNPPGSGPQPFSRASSQHLAETRQQERLDDRAGYPGYGQDEPDGRPKRGASGDFQGPGGRDGFGTGGYAAPDAYTAPGYTDYDGAPSAGRGSDEYNGYSDQLNSEDPYQDRYGDGTGPGAAGGGGRGRNRASGGGTPGPLSGKRLLYAALAVVAVGIIAVAAYFFVLKPGSSSNDANAQGPLPTSGTQPSQQACAKQLGTYCHISAATDDPKPLTPAELYPPAFANEQDKTSYTLVSTKTDTKCQNAVIGAALIKALQAGKCTQVVRGSYVSGDKKIMGTIGVINLSTTNEAHYAGKVVGQNDFIAPLTSKTGVASKLGNGTGVVEAEFKGHYLILTWSEFVNGTKPTTKPQDSALEQFSNDLVEGTANIDLSQRMVNGAPTTAGAST